MATAHVAQAKKKAFLAAFVAKGNISGAARVAGVARRTVYEWLGRDGAFRDSFAEAEQDAIDGLEGEAIRRAFDGSDTLLIFLLKAARPSKYRERVDVSLDVRAIVTRFAETAGLDESAVLAEADRILADSR